MPRVGATVSWSVSLDGKDRQSVGQACLPQATGPASTHPTTMKGNKDVPQRLDNISEEEQRAFEPMRPVIEATLGGFLPNSLFIMAHNQDLVVAFGLLSRAVFRGSPRTKVKILPLLLTGLKQGLRHLFIKRDPPISDDLRSLIFLAVSYSAGCRYCQAHSVTQAIDRGVAQDKIDALLDYEESPLFSDAERAVLDLAFAAGSVPNETTDAHFIALKQHFSTQQITDIVAAIAYMGFLNRWNDTLATTLETRPKEMAAAHLKEWQIGRHGGPNTT